MLAFVGQAELPDDLRQLHDTIAVHEVLPRLVEGLDPDAPVDCVSDPGGVDWLPDLSFAHVGLPMTTNAFQVLLRAMTRWTAAVPLRPRATPAPRPHLAHRQSSMLSRPHAKSPVRIRPVDYLQLVLLIAYSDST